MLTDIARQPFQLARQIDQSTNFLIVLIQPPQFHFLFDGLVQGHADLERNQLGDAIHIAVGMTEHPTDIAHHRLGCHGAMGGDLRYPLATVALGDVFNHPVAPFHAEIDVEIRHRHPFGIEKTLEQQVVSQRVQIGDAQGISHQRTSTGTTPRPDWYRVVTRPLDEIGHDQEIAGKAHLQDDF